MRATRSDKIYILELLNICLCFAFNTSYNLSSTFHCDHFPERSTPPSPAETSRNKAPNGVLCKDCQLAQYSHSGMLHCTVKTERNRPNLRAEDAPT